MWDAPEADRGWEWGALLPLRLELRQFAAFVGQPCKGKANLLLNFIRHSLEEASLLQRASSFAARSSLHKR